MKSRVHLIQDAKGLWLLDNGKEVPVLNTKLAADCLKVSHRQVYRYLENQLLRSYGKVLGDWIIDQKSVEQLRDSRPTQQPIPGFLQYLFPEYDLQMLNVGRDRSVLVTRILEHGSLNDVQWVMKRYKQQDLIDCLNTHGSRMLSSKTMRFWCLYFGIKERRTWRSDSKMWKKSNEMA